MFQVAICLVACFFFEKVLPRNRTLSSFAQFRTGALWLLANVVILPLIIANLSWHVGQFFFLQGVGGGSKAVQFFIGFLVLDFAKYVIHYAFHRIPFLWNFHKVHHSIEYLTALSSFRISWVEGIINLLAAVIVCSLLGLQIEVVFIINMISMMACLLQHANFRMPFTNWLEKIFVTPDNHTYHHSKRFKHPHGQNFGFVLNIWDRLFKTYTYPQNVDQEEIGLADEKMPDRFERQFFYPFIKSE